MPVGKGPGGEGVAALEYGGFGTLWVPAKESFLDKGVV